MKNKNRKRVLYTLLSVQAVSLLGTRMTSVALGIWIYLKTGKAMDILLIPFFNELPSLLFGHVIGTFVDRQSRKQTIMCSDFAQAVCSLLLMLSIVTGRFSTKVLYSLVFFQGLFTAFQEPAADSAIAGLTEQEERRRVNSIKEITFPAAGVFAPVLAGALFLHIGIEGVIAVDLATFAFAAVIMSKLDMPKRMFLNDKAHKETSFIKALKEGMQFVRSHKPLLHLLIIMSVGNFLLNGPIEMVIPYLIERTGSTVQLSLALSVMSIATFASSTLLSCTGSRKKNTHLLAGAFSVSGTAMLFFGVAKNGHFLILTLFLMMLPLPVLNIVFKTLLQNNTPEAYQGRVFATAYQWAYGIAPVSFLVYGWLADHCFEKLSGYSEHGGFLTSMGIGKASGFGMFYIVSGFMIVILAFAVYKNTALKNIEASQEEV